MKKFFTAKGSLTNGCHVIPSNILIMQPVLLEYVGIYTAYGGIEDLNIFNLNHTYHATNSTFDAPHIDTPKHWPSSTDESSYFNGSGYKLLEPYGRD